MLTGMVIDQLIEQDYSMVSELLDETSLLIYHSVLLKPWIIFFSIADW